MKRFPKTFLLLLALLLPFSALAACGGKKQDPKPMETSSEEITAAPAAYLEAADYGNAEFIILGSVADAEGGRHFSEFEGDLNGSHLDIAIYRRDVAIQDKHNVAFRINRTKDWNTMLREATLSNDSFFHIATPGISNAVLSVAEGNVANLDDFPNFDFSNPWWNAEAMEQMSVLGKHLFAMGDLNLLAYDSVAVIFYNKQMAENLGVTDLYERVQDGTWTYDSMMATVKDVTADTSGDGVYGVGDTYGLAGGSYSALCFTFAGNYSFVQKDEDGIPTLRENNNEFFSFFQKVVKNHSDPTLIGYNLDDGDSLFGEQRLLFAVNMLGTSNDLRSTQVSYGILPVPKWNAEQTDYWTFPHQSASTTVCAPIANHDVEMTSRIVEDLVHYSRENVLNYYIQENLYLKSLNGDRDSYNIVLDLLGHLNCDIFFSYRAGITQVLRDSLDNHDGNITSKFEKYKGAFKSQLAKVTAGLLEEN